MLDAVADDVAESDLVTKLAFGSETVRPRLHFEGSIEGDRRGGR